MSSFMSFEIMAMIDKRCFGNTCRCVSVRTIMLEGFVLQKSFRHIF